MDRAVFSFPVAKVLGIGGGPAVCPDSTTLLGPGKSRLCSKVSPVPWGKWSVAQMLPGFNRQEGQKVPVLILTQTSWSWRPLCSSSLTPTMTLGGVLKVSHFWVSSDSSGARLYGSQDTWDIQEPHSPRLPLWRRYWDLHAKSFSSC